MSENDCAPLKVMLAEDNVAFRRTPAEFLRSRFPSVVLYEAADGSEVMEKVKNFRPQLIFMDIRLPGLNGLELTKQIKVLYPEIQVVIITSNDFPEYREAARVSGAYGIFPKASFTSDQVHDIVEDLRAKWKTSSGQSV